MLSIDMRPITAIQDLIPCTCFMEGKIFREISLLQDPVLASSPPPTLSIADWTKHFITHLLKISHTQWVFHNVSLHDHTVGYLHDVKRQKVLQEID